MKYLTICLVVLSMIMSSCDGEKPTYILIETDMGTMKAVLFDSTPKHQENMVKLAKEGFYDGTLFHRVIDGFMVQGGDPDSKNAAEGARLGVGGPGYKVDAEIGSPHFRGTLAAARQGGPSNPTKQSSGSQFYIVQGRPVNDQYLDNIEQQKNIKYSAEQRAKYKSVGGTPQLDADYTVFGEVIEGLDVIDKIAKVQKDSNDRPLKDVAMKITVID